MIIRTVRILESAGAGRKWFGGRAAGRQPWWPSAALLLSVVRALRLATLSNAVTWLFRARLN